MIVGDSPGGDSQALFAMVRLARTRVQKLYIAGQCLSACAEFVALSGLETEISKNAYIGFHIGPVVAEDLARNVIQPRKLTCIAKNAIVARIMAKEVERNADKAASEIEKRQLYQNIKVIPWVGNSRCDNIRVESERRFWFPTQSQLRELFSINLKVRGGKLCNEDLNCLANKLKGNWVGSQAVTIGDRYHTLNLGS